MDIKTKFNFEDTVYHVSQYSPRLECTCESCEGKRKITIKGKEFSCPDCYGVGQITKRLEYQHYPTESLTIGCIIVRLVVKEDCYLKDERQYMAKETGIGSGQIYNEKDLFSTKEEAQKECDKRNSK